MCLFISCAAGTVVHSGDWNLDPTPVIGGPTNSDSFKDLGKKGVLAYIGDSTNANVDGRSVSEADVRDGLTKLFAAQKGRILITIFASNIGRIDSILWAADTCERQVAVAGRSLHRMVSSAKACGYLRDVPEFVSEGDLEYIPHDKTVLLVTGSQGEARAALARIARGQHSLKIGRGDTVIFSARAIPGNETEINQVKNNLVAAGVKVITPDDTQHVIHASGHPRRDEIRDMLQWLKPQIVVPVHGERVMLEAQAELAGSLQIPHAIVPMNGAVIRLDPQNAGIIGHVETGILAVEPKRIMTSDHFALSERRKLQFTGTAHISLVINKKGKLLLPPLISTMGLFDEQDQDEAEFVDSMIGELAEFIDNLKGNDLKDDEVMAEKVRIALRNYINSYLGLKPKTTVHVSRV
jgi:ribonuclease J